MSQHICVLDPCDHFARESAGGDDAHVTSGDPRARLRAIVDSLAALENTPLNSDGGITDARSELVALLAADGADDDADEPWKRDSPPHARIRASIAAHRDRQRMLLKEMARPEIPVRKLAKVNAEFEKHSAAIKRLERLSRLRPIINVLKG